MSLCMLYVRKGDVADNLCLEASQGDTFPGRCGWHAYEVTWQARSGGNGVHGGIRVGARGNALFERRTRHA